MEGAAGSSVTTRTHQLIPELHKQFNRVILSIEPRNPLTGCGADTEHQGSGERERRKQAGDTEIPVYRGLINSCVPVFAAKTWKCG